MSLDIRKLVTYEQPRVASHVTTFIRQPGWICPILAKEYHVYTDEQKLRFHDEPGDLQEVRRAAEIDLNRIFHFFRKESSMQRTAVAAAKKNMQDKFKLELAEKLIPDFPLGCRRLTVSLTSQTLEVMIDQ